MSGDKREHWMDVYQFLRTLERIGLCHDMYDLTHHSIDKYIDRVSPFIGRRMGSHYAPGGNEGSAC